MTQKLPDNLQTYQDWIDDAVRFYPEWVLLSSIAILKKPTSKDANTDLWRSVGGLYLAAARLKEIETKLLDVWPSAKEGIQKLKRLASKIDDQASVLVANLNAISPRQKTQDYKRIAALVTLYLHEVEALQIYVGSINLKS